MRTLAHNQEPRFGRKARVTAAVASAVLAGGLAGVGIARATGGGSEAKLSPAAAAATGERTTKMASDLLAAGNRFTAIEHQRTERAHEQAQQLAEVDTRVNALGLRTARKMLGMVKRVMGNENTADYFPTDEPALGISYAGKHRMTTINAGYQGDDHIWIEGSTSPVANAKAPIDNNFSVTLQISKRAGDELAYIGKHRNPTASDFLNSLESGAQVIEIATMPSDTPQTGQSFELNPGGHYNLNTETLQTPSGAATYGVAIGPQITNPSSLAPITGYVNQSVLNISAALQEPTYYAGVHS